MAEQPRVLLPGNLPIHLHESNDSTKSPVPSISKCSDELAESDLEVFHQSDVTCSWDGQSLGSRSEGEKGIRSPSTSPASQENELSVYRARRNEIARTFNHSRYKKQVWGEQSLTLNDDECEYERDVYSSTDEEECSDSEYDQVAQTGQQFAGHDVELHNISIDIKTELQMDIDSPSIIIGDAHDVNVAPFRDGGLPRELNIKHYAKEPSVVTDFGELLYTSSRRAQTGKHNFPHRSPVRHLRRPSTTLQDRLFSILQFSQHSREKEFFPRDELARIVTEHCVYEELLRQLDPDVYSRKDILNYAKEICSESATNDEERPRKRSYRKIFVILVLIGKISAVIKFLAEGINDSDLPFVKVPRRGKKGSFILRLSRNKSERLNCFGRQWDQLHIRNFVEYQWKVLAPFFSKGELKRVKHYKFQDEVILPFIRNDSTEGHAIGNNAEIRGGFGTVSKINIHPQHHNFRPFDDDKTRIEHYAVKKLIHSNKKQFRQEVEMLKRFSYPAQSHLISLLATYEQSGAYFLIFPWAEADLRRYWRVINPKPYNDIDSVVWMASQCKGLAEGIMSIHQYTSIREESLTTKPIAVLGHHGDIKPENILWFHFQNCNKVGNRGTLQLSDFGLAEFSQHRTRSMQPKSSFATSPHYRAPEVDIELTGAIGRSYDIWTLGCILLEFVTWQIGGWVLLELLTYCRMGPTSQMFMPCSGTFFNIKYESLGSRQRRLTVEPIKPEIIDFVNKELRSHAACSEFLRELLDMIMQNMLVLNQKECGQKENRLTSQEVCTKLCAMLRRCKRDAAYACNALDSAIEPGNTSPD